MKPKQLLLIVAALIIGIVIGRQTVTQPAPATSNADSHGEIQTPKNFENLQKVVDVDLQEYYRLKSEEARYKKADEILSKIITIFLADLGMKISKPSASELRVADTGATPTSQAAGSTESAPTVAKKVEAPSPLATRGSLAEIRTSEEIADFLKASATGNFEDTVKTSSGFSNKSGLLQSMTGQFQGSAIVMDDGKSERWTIEMRLNAKMQNDKLNGRRSLKLSRRGRVFSNSSGNGDLDQAYREIAGDPEAIVIAAGPDQFLQAYYVKSTDQVVGHIMKKGGLSEPFKSIGTFELSRF